MRTHRIIDVISFTKQDSDRAISVEIYVITRSPRKEITRKGAFFGATIMEQQRQQKKTKTLETTFYSFSKEEKLKFPSLSNLCILLSLLLVSIKTVSHVCV